MKTTEGDLGVQRSATSTLNENLVPAEGRNEDILFHGRQSVLENIYIDFFVLQEVKIDDRIETIENTPQVAYRSLRKFRLGDGEGVEVAQLVGQFRHLEVFSVHRGG